MRQSSVETLLAISDHQLSSRGVAEGIAGGTLTGGALGVLLDVTALTDEGVLAGVLGAGKAALGLGAQLGGEPHNLALGNHGEWLVGWVPFNERGGGGFVVVLSKMKQLTRLSLLLAWGEVTVQSAHFRLLLGFVAVVRAFRSSLSLGCQDR